MRPETLDKLREAARIVAAGGLLYEAANAIGVGEAALSSLKARHADLWRELLADAEKAQPKRTHARNASEIAAALGVSSSAVQKWAKQGAPIHLPERRKKRGPENDLDAIRAWLAEREANKPNLDTLREAARIVAGGGLLYEAANAIGISATSLSSMKARHADLWRQLLAEAEQAQPKRTHASNASEIAAALGVSSSAVQKWAKQGAPIHLPEPRKKHGPENDLDAIRAWLKEREAIKPKRKLSRMPTGPGADVRAGIAKATAAIAAGRTMKQAAQAADATLAAMRDWQRRYSQLWQTALDNALAAQVDVIRQQAGTDAVLDDPDRYLRSAALCDRWTEDRGESLFPTGTAATLASFYATYYRPNCMPDARARTLEKYAGIVRLWCYLTGDPPLESITPAVLVKFRDCVAQRRGKKPGSRTSPNSVRGILKHIQAIIDKAGPPARRNRDAAGLIDNPPYVKPPRETKSLPRVVTSEHIENVYLAAVAAELPRIDGIKPPAWWKALLVTAYNTGLRRESLFSLRMDNVRWEDCQLELKPDQMKTAVGLRLPLNSTVMEHLQGIRTDRELLFPWPHSSTHFYTVLYRIEAAAGISADDRFALHDLRRTAATLLWETSPQAAQLVLGHETLKTAQQHYINGRGIVATALAAMPQPAAFGGETAGAQ